MNSTRSTVQTVALVFGVVYLAIGIVGFLPFLGGSYTQTPNNLLSLVPIDLLHNIVHLVIGIAGIGSASNWMRSRVYLQVFGIVLLLVGVIGLFVNNPFGLIPLGGFDVAIHLLTGAVLAYFGFVPQAEQSRFAA